MPQSGSHSISQASTVESRALYREETQVAECALLLLMVWL